METEAKGTGKRRKKGSEKVGGDGGKGEEGVRGNKEREKAKKETLIREGR